MYTVRKTYLIIQLIMGIFLILFAALTPVYVTPGYYYWSAFCVFLLLSNSFAYTKRINQWGDLGEI